MSANTHSGAITPAMRTVGAALRWLFLLGALASAGLSSPALFAASIPSPVTLNFNSNGWAAFGQDIGASYTTGDFRFTYANNGGWNLQGYGTQGVGDSASLGVEAFSGAVETLTIETVSGNEFDFQSYVDVNYGGNATAKAEGYRDTVLVATKNSGFSTSGSGSEYTTTMGSAFENVDKVVITSTSSGFLSYYDNFVFGTAVIPASAPTATTGAASSINASGATLNGTINDNGASTTVTFDYGTTMAYGTNVAATTGGTVNAGAGSTSVAVTLSGLSCNTTYHFRVKGVNSAGTTYGSNASFTTSQCSQTITFTNPGAQNFGTTPTLTATATSGLAVSFTSSTTGVCTITSGGALTFVTSGTCTINADQSGNATYAAASTVSRSFTVNAVVPGAPTIGTATAGDTQASVAFSAPASNGGAAITGYTVTSSPGGLTGTGASSPITVTGLTNGTAYTFTVTATNSAGTGSASAASNSVTPKASQTITFTNPGAQNFGTTPTLTATAGSGLTVTFSSSTTGVCTITGGGTLTFVTTGTCTIDADQAGNNAYLAASTVSRSFSVNAVVPGAPTIGTATAGDTQASVAFSAPASNGGAAITGYTVIASPGGNTGTGASSPITVTGLTNGTAYTFTVTATNSAGTGSASAASNSVTPMASQTITFNNPGAQNFGTTPTLTATATSGLTVTFTSSTTGVCTITSGGALTFVTGGTCTIDADQAGNGSYLAAPTVSRSFSVNAVVPGAPTIGTAIAGNAQASVSFSAPASNGGAAITGYTVTSSPGGVTGTGVSSPIAVTGLTNGTAYTFTVTATNSAGTGSASAASNSVTPATVPDAPTIGTATAGNAQATVSFTAPASNGGSAVTGYTVTSSPGGVTGTGASSPITVTGLTNGTAYTFTVTATNNVGTGNASAASNSVTPATVPDAPTIGTAVAGSAQATISFTAPASNGGSAITGYTVTSNPGGVTGTGASSPITVTGLTDGTAYTFTVTASNSVGTSNASAASNSVTPSSGPGITAPADITVNATGLFTPVAIGTATVTDNTLTPSVTQLNGQAVTATPTHFRPGANVVTWSVTDGGGTTATAIQQVNVIPLVDFSKSQVSAEGATVTIKVILNGTAVSYPVTVPYTVAGTAAADGSDHSLTNGSVTINQPDLEATLSVTLVHDGAGEGTESLLLTMATPTNAVAGAVTTHTVEIREGNVAPTVALSANQGNGATRLIGQASGAVTVTAVVADPNAGDTHVYDWTGTDNALVDGDGVAATFTFDPTAVTPGVYTLRVQVSDGAASANTALALKIEATLPVLTAVDSDNDGVNDDVEGSVDGDGDGVPDYLDHSDLARNVLQEQQATATQYLMETEPGLVLTLGDVALRAGGHKSRVTTDDVEAHAHDGAGAVADSGYTYGGGVFDFMVSDLPVAGQSVTVVLAQFAAIPAAAVYRKLMPAGYQDFVVDANNAIASAAGAAGYCPPPGDAAYSDGLTEGDWCVQVTIEDGGPNDADGAADQRVSDPGGVTQQTAPAPSVAVSGGGGAVSPWWLVAMSAGAAWRRLRYLRVR